MIQLLLIFLVSFCHPAFSQQKKIRIAVIPKTKNIDFYKDSHRGCESVAKKHPEIECLYDGPNNFQDIRSQDRVVKEMIKKGVDGILISITDSRFLINHSLKDAIKRKIPIITYDSDLDPKHQDMRLAYVGTNNEDFGRALGEYAKKFKKKGSKRQLICIQSGHKTTPNLVKRIQGVRLALSKDEEDMKLNGEDGWYEHDRCPLYTIGKPDLAQQQLTQMLKSGDDFIFIAVAGFAQLSNNYEKSIFPFKSKIKSNRIPVISGDTEPNQLRMLKKGLSTVNIGQRPYDMGVKGTELLYNFIKNKKSPEFEFNYIKYYYCTQENADTCKS